MTRGGHQTIAVQFTPPPGVTPGLVGTIIDEKADPIDVSAAVIDLAVRGYLTIEEIPGSGMFSRTDWTLTRRDEPAGDSLLPYERTVLEGIFSSSTQVSLSSLKNRFAPTLQRAQEQMYAETLRLGWFRRSPQATRAAWQMLGVVVAGVGGFLVYQSQKGIVGQLNDLTALGAGLMLAGLIILLLGSRMVARTAAGSAVSTQALGFKEYLVRAEADQIAFDEASMIFSAYLPYAVVFGVAQRWAQTFAQVAQAAQAAGYSMAYPNWYFYSGGGIPDFTHIADGTDAFSTTSTGTFTSTPGSSGSSGFSGGGFSGGGVGGSSSGSW